MLATDALEHLARRTTLPFGHGIEAATNAHERLGSVERVQQALVRSRILDDNLGTAVHGEDRRATGSFESAKMLSRVALEVAERIDVLEANHRRSPGCG
jgi:hypothetical protein